VAVADANLGYPLAPAGVDAVVERLLIPHLLPLHDLATYGILAAIVGSLFRVVQMGVGYSLLPRLRAAPGVLERRRLVAQETRLVILSVISRLGWIAVAVAAVAAIAGARWGLPGVIYGVGLGWLVRSFTALYTTARHLRLPAAAMAVPS
jgi:hypothetical protein